MLTLPLAIETNNEAYAPSTLYTMTLNGLPCPVRRCRVSRIPFNRPWPGRQRPLDQTEEAGYVSFAADEAVEIEVTVVSPGIPCGRTPKILPQSAHIPVTNRNGKLCFRLEKAGQYVLTFGDLHHVLHIFFDPVKEFPESRQATYYFGPGVHFPGLLTLHSNDTVYVDRQAIVFTSILAKHADNVRIYGGGVIDCSAEERISGSCYGDDTKSIRFYFCRNIRLEDVIILNSPNWSLSTYCCSNVTISGIKITGQWRYNCDGIDLCNTTHAQIINTFVRSFDDTIVLKGIDYRNNRTVMKNLASFYSEWPEPMNVEDISVRHCVLWCDWGQTLEIGFETAAPEYRNILFEDCDLIHNSAAALSVHHGDNAEIHDVTFRDIRVEFHANEEPKVMQESDEQKYEPGPVAGMAQLINSTNSRITPESPWGVAHDIRFEKIKAIVEPGCPKKPEIEIHSLSPLAPYGRHVLSDLTVNGQAVHQTSDLVDLTKSDLSLIEWE